MTGTTGVRIPAGGAVLEGDLALPADAAGIVLFAHGSGSSRFSSRNRYVARALNEAALGTLLIDLLTPDEEAAERHTAHLRFDMGCWRRGWRPPFACFAGTRPPARRDAMARMKPDADVRLEIVPGASHLFEEPGTLEEVARLAAEWLTRHLRGAS